MLKFNLPRKYLSASAISTLLRCPKQFEFRYILDIVSPPSEATLTGKAAHGAFEHYYNDAMSTKTVRMTPKMVAECSVDVLKKELEEAEFELPTPTYDSVVNELLDLTTTYIAYVGKDVRPVSTELPFTYTSQCGVEIYGFLDLIEELQESADCEEPPVGLADYKVTNKKWNLSKLVNSLQFNIYSLATGIQDIAIHNLVKGVKSKKLPNKPPVEGVTDVTNNIRIISSKFNPRANQHFENMIFSAAQLITAGIFMPCDPEAWCCNDKWCGYWEFCRGAGLSTPTIVDMAPPVQQDSHSGEVQ